MTRSTYLLLLVLAGVVGGALALQIPLPVADSELSPLEKAGQLPQRLGGPQ